MIRFERSFPFMKDIYYDNENFIERVQNQREAIYYSDRRMLKDNKIKYAFNEWNELPEGRFAVDYKKFRFDCVFHRNQGPLFVILNGALFGKIPEFKRWSYYNFLQGSMLNIADPMYHRFKDLKLGWYYGDEENNLREYLSFVILKAARMLGLSNQEIIIMGSSGGGAAAIQTGSFINGSTVIAINSQIKLALYYYHETFKEITGIDLCKQDKFNRNDTINYLMKESNLSTNFVFINNIRSAVDCDQIDHLLSRLPVRPKYGISQYENLTFWLYDAVASGKGGSHGAQEYHQIFYAIAFLVNCIMNDVPLSEYEALFLVFSEMWSDHFKLVEDIKKTQMIHNRNIELIRIDLPKEYLKRSNLITGIGKKKIIASKNEKYKNHVIANEFRPKTLYCLYIEKIESIDDKIDEFTILIRDIKENEVYCRKDLKFGSDIKYFFMTAYETDEMELRIYCGKPAHTNGRGICIEGLKLVRLTEEQEDKEKNGTD